MDNPTGRISWTVAEVAEKTGASKFVVYQAIKTGDLRAKRHGRGYLVADTAVREWVGESQPVAA